MNNSVFFKVYNLTYLIALVTHCCTASAHSHVWHYANLVVCTERTLNNKHQIETVSLRHVCRPGPFHPRSPRAHLSRERSALWAVSRCDLSAHLHPGRHRYSFIQRKWTGKGHSPWGKGFVHCKIKRYVVKLLKNTLNLFFLVLFSITINSLRIIDLDSPYSHYNELSDW